MTCTARSPACRCSRSIWTSTAFTWITAPPPLNIWMPSSAISTGRRSSSATHKRSGSPPPEPIGFPKERRSAMKWVTRERPKIDRIACPWLITRFIDDAPEFLYVPADQVFEVAEREGAIAYDIPGAEFSHVGEKCSFDAFLDRYGLGEDPALQQPATIVRGADTSHLDLTPQSSGLFAISDRKSTRLNSSH